MMNFNVATFDQPFCSCLASLPTTNYRMIVATVCLLCNELS
jgi:hypothetical protein